jgi:hypothetical protein
MTRERALKTIIRARAAKTGERYTTARRHVLAQRTGSTSSTSLKPALARSTAAASRSPVSDAKILEKTGHPLEYWFTLLDRFGAAERGHTATARHLVEDHQVPGWHAQGITVAYERARGLRVANQRLDGAYEVSVSKTMAGGVPAVINALKNALGPTVRDTSSKGVIVRPDGLARWRCKWNGTVVQWYLEPKTPRKTSVVVQHTKLPDADAVERYRAHWRKTLGAVAQRVAG